MIDKLWRHENRYQIEKVYLNPEASENDAVDYLQKRLNDNSLPYEPIGSPFVVGKLLCLLLYWPKPD